MQFNSTPLSVNLCRIGQRFVQCNLIFHLLLGQLASFSLSFVPCSMWNSMNASSVLFVLAFIVFGLEHFLHHFEHVVFFLPGATFQPMSTPK